MITTDIAPGTPVEFDSEHGPQTGIVIGLIQCVTNGRKHAAVEINHDLDGILWNVPVDTLKKRALTA